MIGPGVFGGGTSSVRRGQVSVTPEAGGAFALASDWSTATGTSENALTDGGLWPTVYCNSAQRSAVMEVVSGTGLGWTRTDNVLQITNRGSTNCALNEHQSAISSTADNYYVRMYIRVEDEGLSSFHSFKMAAQGPIQLVYWAIAAPVAGVSYRQLFRPLDGNTFEFGYHSPVLDQQVWYRHEYRVHFHDPANPLRFQAWPRIYSLAGTLLYDANDFTQTDTSTTLAEDYAAGQYGVVDSRDRGRRIALGYEGNALATDTGNRWFYADLKVSEETWVGDA